MASASARSAAESQAAEEGVLRITRRFKAPRALVYKMFTDPAHLARWFGPVGFTARECKLEPKPGGALSCDMLSPQGTLHRLRGRFVELSPDRRVAFTWSWLDAETGQPGYETVVTLDLAERGNETELSLLHQTFQNADQHGKHNAGWESCFVCLDQYLAELEAQGRVS